MSRDSRQNNIRCFVLFALVSLLVAFSAISLGMTVEYCVRFWGFQLLSVFVPGLAFTRRVFSESDLSIALSTGFSVFFGYAFSVAEYFITALFGLTSTVAVSVSFIVFIAAAAYLVMDRHEAGRVKFSCKELPFAVLFVLFLILVFFAYSAFYRIPGLRYPDAVYHADALYWVENAAALMHSFPPQELRMSGSVLYYHYFASAYLAQAALITGIDVFSLAYAFYPLIKTVVLFTGLYCLVSSFIIDSKLQLFAMIALLFSTGYEKYSIANYTAHILLLPFGFDMAYGFGAFFLAALHKQYKKSAFDLGTCVAAFVAFLMCAGHKAPIALVYLFFAFVICLFWLIKGKKRAFAYGIPAVLAFVAVMFVCVGFFSGGESRVNAGGFSQVATLRASPLFVYYENASLSGAGGVSAVIKALVIYAASMLVLVASIWPLGLVLVLFACADIVWHRKADTVDMAFLLVIVIGLFMGLFNSQEGVSQLYYTLCIFAPSLMLGLRHFSFRGCISNAFAAFAAILLIVQVKWFFIDSSTFDYAKEGMSRTFCTAVSTVSEPEPYSIQQADYAALCWLRDNSPSEAIAVSDRSVLTDIDNYMYYGTFSERQMYLEGDRYFYNTWLDARAERRETIRSLYSNDLSALEKVHQDGVDYIIQTKWLTPDYRGDGCVCEYESQTLAIWRIGDIIGE